MANYDVSIKIAIAGAKELDRVNKQTEKLRSSINAVNKTAEFSGKKPVRNFNNLSKSVQDARDALDEAATGTKEFNQAVKNLVQVEGKFDRQLKQRERRLQIQRLAQKEGISFSKAKILLAKQEAEAEAKLAASKQKTANAEKRRRIGGTISSAAIGGAFPLLFGQTGAAAVGGGVGGALGGLIGGQFGFALSIVGTAVGSLIQKTDELNKSVLKLDIAFKTSGDSAGFTKENLNQLKNTLRLTKEEALQVAGSFTRFGEAGKAAAFIFGDNPNTFKNLAAMKNTRTLMTAILDEQNGLNIKQQIQLLREAKLTSFKDMQLKLNRMILEENFKRELTEARQITLQDKITDALKRSLRVMVFMKGLVDPEKLFPDFFKTSSENMEERVDEIKKFYDELLSDLPELQTLLTELDTQVQGMSYSIPSAIDSVSAELKKLMSVGYMVTTVADTVGSAFGESFKGIVKGSMTAQDALRNLFMRTADAFLDMAAQLIAKQIQMKILGIGLNFFGGGLGGSGGGQFLDSNAVPLVDPLTGIGTAANGGYIPGRKPTLVGERGAELFVPNTGGTVIPNHDLGGFGGSTNIVVNVDASGSSVEGDEEQGRELGRMISAAIQSELIKQKRPGGYARIMATFPSIKPTYGQQKRSAPNTRTIRFADGFEHRILFGLAEHQNPKVYNFTFNVSETDADTIETFLDARANDSASFDFTAPGEAASQKFVCETWNKSIPYNNRATIQATFREVFEP